MAKVAKKPVVKKKTAPKAKAIKSVVKASKPAATLHSEAKGTVANVLGVDGKAKGKITLPKELFGAKVNQTLVAQAVRVYLANQRQMSAFTRTRGEVTGSTRKIYRQKGTGKARHGGIRAPIFVGGGITFGPRLHDFSMSLPTKMKQAALASALTSQFREGNVIVVDGAERLEPKTKRFAKLMVDIGVVKNALLVVPTKEESIVRGSRNLETVETLPPQNLNTYTVLSHATLVFTKDAVEQLKETFIHTK